MEKVKFNTIEDINYFLLKNHNLSFSKLYDCNHREYLHIQAFNMADDGTWINTEVNWLVSDNDRRSDA